MNMVLEKERVRGHIFKKTSFHASLLGNGLIRDFHLKFGRTKYYEILVILPKLGLMNHCNNFFLQVYNDVQGHEKTQF
jgi:hypothetical protein